MEIIEGFLVEKAKFTRVLCICQLYIRRNEMEMICRITAKIADDILTVGCIDDMQNMAGKISNRFKINRVIIEKKITFRGCRII